MKTLADLKRNLTPGKQLTLIEYIHGDHRSLNIPRYIIKANTTGVILATDKDATKGSHMDFPAKATLLTYEDDTFAIHQPGRRPLNPEEQRVYDGQPSHLPEWAEQCKTDIMTDGSQMYWRDKSYLKANHMEYLGGSETVRGLRFDFNTREIIDESIKGPVELKYKIL